MKKRTYFKFFTLLSLIALIVGCASAKTENGKKLDVAEKDQFKQLEQLVDSRSFTIVSDWANPLNGNQINFYGNRFDLSNLLPPGSGGSRVSLIGNGNSLTISKDSVKGFLPYYGEVQVVKNYGGGGGITFDGLLENYKVKKDIDNGLININFEADDESEHFQVAIKLYSNFNAHIALSSAYRNSISYDGEIKVIEEM